MLCAVPRMRPGTVLAVRSQDPSARLDLPAWCRMTGHGYLGNDDHEPEYIRTSAKAGH